MMKTRFGVRLAVASTALWLAACGGGGGGGIAGTGITGSGSMHVLLTDAPACGYDAVNITVDRLRVNQDSNAADSAGGWSEVVLNPARRINLLNLTNGVMEDLGQTTLPAGKYTQLRLVLAPNSSADPLANSVTPSGQSETALTTPSGQQSGLKLDVNMTVAAGQTADFVLDFDACKSIVKRGNSGNYNLKPVMAVIPYFGSAGQQVVGYVSTSLSLASTTVALQAGGVPVKATVPDSTGKFTLSPVPAGSYDLVITSPGYVTAVMTAVPVTTSAVTTVNATGTAILPPSATVRTVSGTLTPATATVRATQALTGGPVIEVAWGAVDATSGAFSFDLPKEAPVKTSYALNPLAPIFVADTAAAGKYTLEAASAGVTKTLPVDASVVVPLVVFSFP